MSYLTFTVWI